MLFQSGKINKKRTKRNYLRETRLLTNEKDIYDFNNIYTDEWNSK